MSSVLLLDLDHTLYPSTAPTLAAVDARITEFIADRLGLAPNPADAMRRELCARYGTTLRGLELLHGVSRNEYTDYIQDLGDHLMPVPDPRLREWITIAARRRPAYLFTNARRDWADRCLMHLGLTDLLTGGHPAGRPLLGGILDIDFMEWAGKPNPEAFDKVETFLTEKHPPAPDPVFADDRLENLDAARARGWRTIWVRPHDAPPASVAGHEVVDSLLDVDPESL